MSEKTGKVMRLPPALDAADLAKYAPWRQPWWRAAPGDGPTLFWMILLSDAAAAPEMLAAASAAGATGAEAPSPDARMVSFSPPEGFELSAP